VSPDLIEMLTFAGSLVAAHAHLVLGACGLLGAGFSLLSPRVQRAFLAGLLAVLVIGVLSEIMVERTRRFFGNDVTRFLFDGDAFRAHTALGIFLIAVLASVLLARSRRKGSSGNQARPTAGRLRNQILAFGVVAALLLLLPALFGSYLSEVVNNVGLFVLMGLGLNIVVGFAGLLDLGYVAFFAIGAYTMGVLTSEGSLGLAGLSFWTALPICVAAAAMAGLLLGVPVLRMRGDYLAIVTLGFGEIIRVLALSDLLKPLIGGAQGVLQIPKPRILTLDLVRPEYVYYIILAGCLLAAFVAWRLSEARLGRQWMAMREDEDVAEAMGIRLVSVKLLAFVIGASFSGLAGAIFASKLTSIFPHSLNLLISINVLCVIIIGGLGSIPGVLVGAIVLVGLPEMLREFQQYRYLIYGVVLIGMMLYKPEGFWPSPMRRRELRGGEEGGVLEPVLPHAPLVREPGD
jgi:branched-chain amino acid transport system permease protein